MQGEDPQTAQKKSRWDVCLPCSWCACSVILSGRIWPHLYHMREDFHPIDLLDLQEKIIAAVLGIETLVLILLIREMGLPWIFAVYISVHFMGMRQDIVQSAEYVTFLGFTNLTFVLLMHMYYNADFPTGTYVCSFQKPNSGNF
jgi:hypothetical protein